MEGENKKPQNPSAFPIEKMTQYGYGMTLRDYFAAKAMESILSHENIGIYLKENGAKTMQDGDEVISVTAYRLADAMLKKREKQE